MKGRKCRLQYLMLCFIFVLAICSGCGKKKEKVVMGRFEEEKVEIPKIKDKVNYEILNTAVDEKNQLKLIVWDNEIFRYTFKQDGSYQKEKVKWLNKIFDEKKFINFIISNEGGPFECVAIMKDGEKPKDMVYQVFCHSKDGKVKQIELEKINERDKHGYLQGLKNIVVTDDGKIVIEYTFGINVYNGKDGKLILHSEDALGLGAVISNGMLYALDKKNISSVLSYNLDTGEAEKPISTGGINKSWGNDFTEVHPILGTDQDGKLYLQDPRGISQLSDGGSEWVSLIDGSLNSLSLPNLQGYELIRAGKDQFYMQCTMGDDKCIIRYSYNKKIPAVPSTKLSIYALRNNETLHTGIVQFEQAHPDVRIEFYAPIQGEYDHWEYDETINDYINSMNTELLSGGGADLLVMDQMDVNSYIQKGVLEDISDIVHPLVEQKKLSETLANTFEEKGKVYALAQRVGISSLSGTKEDLKYADTMEHFADQIETKKDYVYRTKSEVAAMLLGLYYREFLNEDGSFKEETIREYFNIMQKLKKYKVNEDVLNDSDFVSVFRHLETVVYSPMVCPAHFYMPCDYLRKLEKAGKDVEMLCPEGVYFPKLVTAVNHASKQKKLAKEFLQFLFEIKGDGLFHAEGLPMNRSLLEKSVSRNDNPYDYPCSYGYSDGESMGSCMWQAHWPKKEQIAGLTKLYDNLSTPLMPHTEIETKILDTAYDVMNGKLDSDKAYKDTMSYLTTKQQEAQ